MSKILLNGDFAIDKKGICKIVVFSENNYRNTYKTKIRVLIKRQTKNGFVVYKKISKTKKGNIAFLKKTFKVKKTGIYQMNVKITRYKKVNNIFSTEKEYYKSKREVVK